MEITDSNYEAIVAEGKPMVVDFWATWCGPCRMVSPIIEALAEQYAGTVNVGKVDVDENEELAAKFGIRNIPTVLFMKDGQIVDKIVGAAAKPVFEEKIKALL
jgi:thioredoxin 1